MKKPQIFHDPELSAFKAKKQRRRAGAFRPNERMEHLLRMKQQSPSEFAKLSATTRMGLGYYLADKQAAQATDDNEGNDAA